MSTQDTIAAQQAFGNAADSGELDTLDDLVAPTSRDRTRQRVA